MQQFPLGHWHLSGAIIQRRIGPLDLEGDAAIDVADTLSSVLYCSEDRLALCISVLSYIVLVAVLLPSVGILAGSCCPIGSRCHVLEQDKVSITVLINRLWVVVFNTPFLHV